MSHLYVHFRKRIVRLLVCTVVLVCGQFPGNIRFNKTVQHFTWTAKSGQVDYIHSRRANYVADSDYRATKSFHCIFAQFLLLVLPIVHNFRESQVCRMCSTKPQMTKNTTVFNFNPPLHWWHNKTTSRREQTQCRTKLQNATNTINILYVRLDCNTTGVWYLQLHALQKKRKPTHLRPNFNQTHWTKQYTGIHKH